MAFELQAEKRTVFGKKVKRLRQAGKIPAEVYGSGTDNISIQVDEKILRQTLKEAGASNLITIQVDGHSRVQALARNIQYSILKRNLLHVDFYTVDMTQKVTITIPIQIVGESPLVRDEGGSVMTGITSLDVEALPSDLPEAVAVDISVLESFSQSISVGDLTMPAGVTALSNPDSMVVTVQPPRISEEEADVDEVAELEVDSEEADDEE